MVESIFKVIPVIDLLNGVVVHAKKGERSTYQPIQSQLTQSSQPLDIVAALLSVYPFEQLYIADLNAIQKSNSAHINNYSVIESIQSRYPNLQLWLDVGIQDINDLNIWKMPNTNLVLGTENFHDLASYLSISKLLEYNFILSIDYFPDGYKGPSELVENANLWPNKVIAMSLAKVGASQGVDINLLKKLKKDAPHNNIYAAGGVRSHEDLQSIKHMQINGALVATSLHTLKITARQLESLQ